MALQSPQTSAPAQGRAEKSPIRVVVIDDSAVIRGLTKRWLSEDPEIEVVASFSNGAHAVAGIAKKECDVAILDIEMPEMDGLTALPLLIKAMPGLQVIIASTLSHRNADISMRALSLGAADYLAKPETNHGLISAEDYRRDLIGKVKALGLARAKKPQSARALGRARPTLPAPAVKTPITLRKVDRTKPKAIVIASSTGGPQALAVVMGALKAQLNIPIFIAQHMPPMFTSILAEQISKNSGHPCSEGRDGELVQPDQIYLAPGDYHMELVRDGRAVRIELNKNAPVNYCRPSADPLFRSVAEIYGAETMGIVLTGMGHDARDGARAIADVGGQVIAQDEATSVVWGMPGAVAQAGLASSLMPLLAVAPEILRSLGGGRL